MADISAIITRKSLKAKQKAAIKTIKAQAQEKIKQIKMNMEDDPDSDDVQDPSSEQRRMMHEQRRNALLSYAGKMPREFTVGEDIFNAISHGIGAGLSVAAIVLLVIHSISSGSMAVLANILFGASLFLMYLLSTLYHALDSYGARRVFSIFTHDAIYVLIAGTITPYLIIAVGGVLSCVMFIIVWAAAIAMVVVYSCLSKKLDVLSLVLYAIFAWILILIFSVTPIASAISFKSSALLVLGGAAYTAGSLFYLMPKYKWAHSIFHVFALGGSILHFFSVWALV